MPYILSFAVPENIEAKIPLKLEPVQEVLQQQDENKYFEEWKSLFALIPTWKAMRCPDGTIICTDPALYDQNLSGFTVSEPILYDVPEDALQFVGSGGYGCVKKVTCKSKSCSNLDIIHCVKEIPITKEDYKLFLRETCLDLAEEKCDGPQLDLESKEKLKLTLRNLVNYYDTMHETAVGQNRVAQQKKTSAVCFAGSYVLNHHIREEVPAENSIVQLQKLLNEKKPSSFFINQTMNEILAETKICNEWRAVVGVFLTNFCKSLKLGPSFVMNNLTSKWLILDTKQKEDLMLFTCSFFQPLTLTDYMSYPRIKDCSFKPLEVRLEILVIVGSLLHSLDIFHKQSCIHRDIKPNNIFGQEIPLEDSPHDKFSMLPSIPSFIIGDFSIARHLNNEEMLFEDVRTSTCTLLNNDGRYAAPEIFSGKGYSNSIDVYAIGVIFYELLSGQQYKGNVSQKFSKSYKEESVFILKLINPEPQKRPNAEVAANEATALYNVLCEKCCGTHAVHK